MQMGCNTSGDYPTARVDHASMARSTRLDSTLYTRTLLRTVMEYRRIRTETAPAHTQTANAVRNTFVAFVFLGHAERLVAGYRENALHR